MGQTDISDLRLAELLASLALAIDLGLGQHMENLLRTCLLATGLGKKLGMSEQDLVDIYYLALIQHLDCTAYANEAAIILEVHAPPQFVCYLEFGKFSNNLHYVDYDRLPIEEFSEKGGSIPHNVGQNAGQCLAERTGLGPRVQKSLGQTYEHWDGTGSPNKLKGEAILLPVRVLRIARDAEIYSRLGGTKKVCIFLQQRAGHIYDPHIVEHFCQHADHLFEETRGSLTWEAVLAAEPGQSRYIPQTSLDDVLHAVADFVDLKSPYTAGHSSGVAELAAEAAKRCGLPANDMIVIRRAGFLHNLGRIGIPNTIWDKRGRLSEVEWERIRLHPYYTERVLARLEGLGEARIIAAKNHERLDGSGYHRGLPASMLSMAARILAVADIYRALIEPRSYRSAHSEEDAAKELHRQVQAGLLDGEAVCAVLMAAGHSPRPRRHKWVAGLSDREIEVLRLVARGHSNQQMARILSVSKSTIHHHIQHIYTKLGVSTRAAVTLFATQHSLLTD